MQLDSSTCRTVAVIGKPVNLAAKQAKAPSHYCGRKRKSYIFIPQQQFACPFAFAHASDQNCSLYWKNRIYPMDEL